MSNSRPALNNVQSLAKRIREIWSILIRPHSSIKSIREFHRAQVLLMLTLILSAVFASALLSRPESVDIFLTLGGITLISYLFGKTKYFRWGTYIFTYSFTAIGYLRILLGTASSIESSITSTVHIALILSSLLLSPGEFLSLAIISTIATFTTPLYSTIPVPDAEITNRMGGIVLAIGAILYGIQIFRENLDRESLKELTEANTELEEIKTNLEQHIEERTDQLEKANRQIQERALRFQTVSEISQEISSNIDQKPKDLLDRIVFSISKKFGFYHVGIFLFDENHEYAVLRAANSEGGERMLARHHQLRIGGTGVVGYVSQSGRPRISLDTGADAVFFNNPDLPETHSEMALPLKYGSKLIGVLDIQSTQTAAFTDENVNLLSTLANQIAIVLDTVLNKDISDYSSARNKIVQAGKSEGQSGYSYLPDGSISTARSINNPILEQALASNETVVLTRPSKDNPSALAVPVRFREQVIGYIHVEASEANRKWTEDEISIIQSISDRAALAIENAQLFEETERRAEREKLIAQVTSRIGESNNIDSILQTTIQELGQALGTTRTFIQLEVPTSPNGDGARNPVTASYE